MSWQKYPWQQHSWQKHPWQQHPWQKYPWQQYEWQEYPWQEHVWQQYPWQKFPSQQYPGQTTSENTTVAQSKMKTKKQVQKPEEFQKMITRATVFEGEEKALLASQVEYLQQQLTKQQQTPVSCREEPQGKQTCVICLNHDVESVFLPCGHIASCLQCGQLLETCPICRSSIRACEKIFFA